MKKTFPYKKALVTGASSGLGACLCRRLIEEGVVVYGVAREASRIRTPGVNPVALDLADSVAVRKFAAETLPGMDVDLLVNCAGSGVFSSYCDLPEEEILFQLNVMLQSPALFCRAALPSMLAQKRGCLVNVSSLAARFPLPCMATYNMVKAGLSALGASLMEEVRGTGVTVLDFQPGDFNSGFLAATRRRGGTDAAWNAAVKHLDGAPHADDIAAKLMKALQKGSSGTMMAGTFFQTRLAPLGQRLLPSALFQHLQRFYTK